MTQSASLEPIHGNAVRAIMKLLSGTHLMTLAVNRPDGRPHASTLGYVNDGLNLYFITAKASQKHSHILADPRVSVVIRGVAEEGEAVGVSIDGRAEVVTNIKEVEPIFSKILSNAPDLQPWAPGLGQTVVIKVIPEEIKAAAVVGGRSQTFRYAIGDPEAAVEGVIYSPSAVARLF